MSDFVCWVVLPIAAVAAAVFASRRWLTRENSGPLTLVLVVFGLAHGATQTWLCLRPSLAERLAAQAENPDSFETSSWVGDLLYERAVEAAREAAADGRREAEGLTLCRATHGDAMAAVRRLRRDRFQADPVPRSGEPGSKLSWKVVVKF